MGVRSMSRKLLLVWIVSTVSLVSWNALAAGPNDGPTYQNLESHKQYAAYRNQDHNNPSPRYLVTTQSNAQHPTYRNLDHNNPSPRYAATTTRPDGRTVAARPGYIVHALRRPALTRSHGWPGPEDQLRSAKCGTRAHCARGPTAYCD
jgi:hypothetical protein